MANVSPAARPHPPHSGRSPRPARTGGDFGRFLLEASKTDAPRAAEETPPEPPAERGAQAQEPDRADARPAPAATGQQGTTRDTEADSAQPAAAAGQTENGAAPVPPTGTALAPPGAEAVAAPQPLAMAAPQGQDLSPAAAAAAVALEASPQPAPAAALVAAAALEARPQTALTAGVLAAGTNQPPAAAPVPVPAKADQDPPAGATAAADTTAPGSGPLARDTALALAPAASEELQTKAPAAPEGHHPPADLFNPGEHLRPEAKVEVAPEPMLDQLQQAMNTALLDEGAQLVMPQVVRGLATLVNEGVSEMRLQLMPEDLGEIELRVRTSEGVVRGEMMVQHPEVKHLLDQHLDRLRDALQQQGLDLRGFDIGLSPDGRFSQPDRSRQGNQPASRHRDQTPDDNPQTAAPVLAPRGAKEVDYLA